MEQLSALAGRGLVFNRHFKLGSGSYGTVIAARVDRGHPPDSSGGAIIDTAIDNSTTSYPLAVKIMNLQSAEPEDYQRILRELRLISRFRHPNIARFMGAIPSPDLQTVGFVFERWATSLSRVLKNKQQQLDIVHVQHFTYQLLRALEYLHGSGVVHCDIKPDNILVTENCQLAIIDFGMSLTVGGLASDTALDSTATTASDAVAATTASDAVAATTASDAIASHLLPYDLVQTSWYRAPEIIMEQSFGTSIDIWSAGCVMAELMRACLPEKKRTDHGALFPCDDEPTIQMAAIYKALGSPPPAMVDRLRASSQRAMIAEAPYPTQPVRAVIADLINESTTKPRVCQLDSMFPYIQEDAVDLLKLMLRFDPMERPTATQLMRHPFFHSVSRRLRAVRIPPVEVSTADIDSLELDKIPKMTLKAKLHDMVYPDLIWHMPPELHEETGGAPSVEHSGAPAVAHSSTPSELLQTISKESIP